MLLVEHLVFLMERRVEEKKNVPPSPPSLGHSLNPTFQGLVALWSISIMLARPPVHPERTFEINPHIRSGMHKSIGVKISLFLLQLQPVAVAMLEAANQLCHRHADGTFACLTCERTFSNQSNCKRHIRLEHLGEDKNATCPNCEKQVLRTDIKRHMKKHCANRHLFAENIQYGY